MNVLVIAAHIMMCRGKSMLTQTEMLVVFVLDEDINQGNLYG